MVGTWAEPFADRWAPAVHPRRRRSSCDGTTKPNASNVNFGAGETIPNLVITKVGTNGRVAIANALGNVDVIGDTVGYFAAT